MRYAKLLACLLALMTAWHAKADPDPQPEALTAIAMGIREHFPRLEISPFSCLEATCSSKIDFVWFSALVVVTMGADAQPVAIAIVTAPPRAERGTDLRELFDAEFKGCAIAVIS